MTEFSMIGFFDGIIGDKMFALKEEDGVVHKLYTNVYVMEKLKEVKIGVSFKLKGHIDPQDRLIVDKIFVVL